MTDTQRSGSGNQCRCHTQAVPARPKSAVKPYGVRWTFDALYPGQTSWALTACGSLMLGINGALASAAAGTVNKGLKLVIVDDCEEAVPAKAQRNAPTARAALPAIFCRLPKI